MELVIQVLTCESHQFILEQKGADSKIQWHPIEQLWDDLRYLLQLRLQHQHLYLQKYQHNRPRHQNR